MIKFIYQVEANEEEACPIGFSFFNTERNCTEWFQEQQVWTNIDEFIEDFTGEQLEYGCISIGRIEHYLDLIPKDWNKVKFKQV